MQSPDKIHSEADQLREELSEKDALIRTVIQREAAYLSSSHDGIVFVDMNGIILDVNQIFCDMIGIDREYVIYKEIIVILKELAAPRDAAAISNTVNRQLSGQQAAPFEIRYKDKILEIIPPRCCGENSQCVYFFHDITNRRQTEEALKRERNQFIAGPVVAFKWAARWSEPMEYVSPNVKKFGYEPQDFVSGRLSYVDIIHPSDRQRVLSESEEYTRSGSAYYEHEYRILAADKTVRWVNDFTVICRDAAGTILNFDGYISDITQRKHYEEAMLREGARAQQYLDIAGVMMLALDIHGTIILVNKKGCSVLGYATEELIGKNWFETSIPPVIRTELRQRFSSMLKGEIEPMEYFENKILQANGCERIIAWHNTFITDCDGVVVGTMSSGEDITERKMVEEALAAEKERLLVTIHSIAEGVITTNISGTIVLMNTVAEQVTGWTLNEAVDKEISRVFVVTADDSIPVDYQPTFSPSGPIGEVVRSRSILQRRDGMKYTIAECRSPIFDSEKKIIGTVVVFRDITEELKIEQNLRNAVKLESLSVLAAGVAHDFNNLLHGIFSYVDLARESLHESDAVGQYLDKAMLVNKRARNLTQQLLTYSKGSTPVKKTVRINQLIMDATSFVLSGSNVTAIYDLAPDLWFVELDENQFAQVIDNIIINARQAMPKGGRVYIKSQNCSADTTVKNPIFNGDVVHLEIKDEGCGITPQNIDRVFDPFFTTKEHGSGLGLSSAYSIIKSHNGWMNVESEPGVGSCFHIYLPASPLKQLPVEEDAVALVAGHGRILVMDDEEFIRDATQRMLSSAGYTVLCVDTPQQAYNAFTQALSTQQPFDCVILDLTIPGGQGGLELVSKLTLLDSHVKTIATSGYAADPVMVLPQHYGFHGRLIKPFRKAELCQLLQSLLTMSVA
ncbi:MAG: PAS domain S-box protein [Chitinivibrionales bacterium]|nr:PAS domain S-box protein [Chitinivibrionales bacterium]